MEERNAERPTDVELMEAVVRRDSDAMAAIYQRYELTLRAVILSVLHEEGETDDVLHDVFIQLWNRADRFVAEKGLHGFLVTLARRRALDRLRRRLAYRRATDRLETQMRAEFNDKMRGPGVKPSNFDLSELLSRMIRLLPEPQQEVVAANIFQRHESARNRCTKIYCSGHSENPITPGSKETVEPVGADPLTHVPGTAETQLLREDLIEWADETIRDRKDRLQKALPSLLTEIEKYAAS
jgi:RNA polymerase sigma-70 factor, ECF subfamily